MEQKTASRHHFKEKRPQTLGSRLTIFSRSILLLASVSIWVTGCGPGSTNNNYYETNKTPNSGAASNFGGGGATGDGGGGQGVMCSEITKDPSLRNRLFVRDIYEAVADKKRTMKNVPGPSNTNEVSDEALQILADSVKNYFGPASYSLAFTKKEYWKNLIEKMVFLDEDRELLPSQDANSPIVLRTGCKLEQIAYWDESPGVNDQKLYVSRVLWNSLDQLNKIALLAHEVFYAQARKALYKNSDAVRFKVGQLLSLEGLKPLFSEWVPSKVPSIKNLLPASAKGFKACEGVSPDDPDAKLYFYQYEGKEGKQHLTFPVVASNSINSSFLQSTSFLFDAKERKTSVVGTDALYFQSIFHDVYDYKTPEQDLFIERMYTDSYLLSEPPSILLFFENLPQNIGGEPVLWSGHLMSSLIPITVSLLNPLSDWEKQNTPAPLTRDEQIVKINFNIRETLETCKVDRIDAEEAIAVLHKEVDSSIRDGKYPRGFPLWNKQLKTLIENLKKGEEDVDFSQCSFTSDYEISETLPGDIYSLKLKTNQPYGGKGLDRWGYERTPDVKVPLGKMRLTQGANKLDFDLRCYDYATSYAEVILKNEQKNHDTPKSPRKLTYSISESLPDVTEVQLNDLKRFANLLTLQTENIRNELYPYFIESWTSSSATYHRPEQVRALLSDLASEQHLKFEICNQRFVNDTNENNAHVKNTSCLITTMMSSGHRYMIYFSYPLSSDPVVKEISGQVPKLEFVQLVP